MNLAVKLGRSLHADMTAELCGIERAVAVGAREAGRGLRTELRRQVTSAGLGQRLANSWRDRHYPNQRLDAASLVYTKAPQIIRAFDHGAVIRSRRGRFLAIPTENAQRKGTDGRRISPSNFPEHRFGPLRFVPRQSGRLTTVVMFLLVPQVKLRKRLDVARAGERWSAQLPALIEQHLRVGLIDAREQGRAYSRRAQGATRDAPQCRCRAQQRAAREDPGRRADHRS
jgi:hypothetical protein